MKNEKGFARRPVGESQFVFARNKGLSLLLLLLIVSCRGNDSSDFYPDIVTEFANIRTDEAGCLSDFTTDDERTYTIATPKDGYNKNAIYRAVCGYVADGQTATLYHATGAHLLRDSTELDLTPDALNVTSVWLSGRYINMQLSPLSQGGTQYWGFRYEGVSGRTTHVSLHHRQNGDPQSYSQTVYASIHVDSLKAVPSGDSIALHFATFQGERVWRFKKP